MRFVVKRTKSAQSIGEPITLKADVFAPILTEVRRARSSHTSAGWTLARLGQGQWQ